MRAQLAIEFVYAIGTVILITVIFMVAIGSQFEDLRKDKEAFLILDLSSSIRKEIFIAAEAQDGFQRSFKVPHNLSGAAYNLTLKNHTITISAPEYENSVKIPDVKGSIAKGTNIIRKEGGVIYLN